MRTKFSALAVLCFVLLAVTGCQAGVNRSFRVADGEKVDSGFTTVNGNVRIGKNAQVGGSSQTVNGSISVGDGSRVEDLSTVNGSIRIDGDVTVDGDIESVNGAVECGPGTRIEGKIASVNGSIRLEGTEVEGRLKTRNGSVTLRAGSRLKQDLVIDRNRSSGSRRSLEIKILESSVVEGDIVVEDREQPVKVFLEEGSEVLGEIQNAEVVSEKPSASATGGDPQPSQ